jgi:hypothetical protein
MSNIHTESSLNSRAVLSRTLLVALILFLVSGVGFDLHASETTLKIEGGSPGRKLVMLVHAWEHEGNRRCMDDKVVPSKAGEFKVGDLPLSEKCNVEIVIFSQDHAMFAKTLNAINDKIGPLQPPIVVPMTVWIARPKTEAIARDEVNNANLLYKRNKVGIQFDPQYKAVWQDEKAVAAIDAGIKLIPQQSLEDKKECTPAIAELQNKYYIRDRLNVYYVGQAFKGRNCAIKQTPTNCKDFSSYPEVDGNITYVGSGANLSTLAHELGHAFGLRPADCGGHDNFNSYSIMYQYRFITSDRFTLGQVFRMNTHKDKWGGTMLLRNKLRFDPERECRPNDRSGKCPALGLDWDGKELAKKTSGRELKQSQAEKALRAATAWFQCNDCESGELRAVAQYGNSVVPTLVAVLKQGMPATQSTQQRRELAARYADLLEQSRKESKFEMGSKSQEEFIERYNTGYDIQYQIRAAQALAAIGGAVARQELGGALRGAKHESVRSAIQQLLKDRN